MLENIESSSEINEIAPDEVDEALDTDTKKMHEQPMNENSKRNMSSSPNLSLREELVHIVHNLEKKEVLPNIVEKLIIHRKLNYIVLDLYDYDKGFEVSFHNYESDEEIFHGRYSYAVSFLEYVRDGTIPYEIFDKLCKYQFPIFYDGYVVCELRINFGLEDNVRPHYVFLKHSIQTIDGECCMNCKSNSELNYKEERARLIKYYSPDLCLDPKPVVQDIASSYELNQHPFISSELNHIILNEKARREKGVMENATKKPTSKESASRNLKPEKQENWSFRLREPTEEETELSKEGSNLEFNDSIKSYLRERPICFPDEKSFTGFPVEIENFEYEYKRYTKKGEVENVIDKFCIAVLNDKEYFYGTYQMNMKKTEKRKEPSGWWDIGNRILLDIYVDAFTYEEMKLTCGGMKITHYRMFDEEIKYSDGKTDIIRTKLEVPVESVVLDFAPPSEDENEEEIGNE